MLEKLGFKRFVYDWRDKDIPTFDEEIEAMKKHGIEVTAWWSPTNAHDPVLQTTLEVFKRQNVHPQLWVMGGGNPTKTPEEQQQRVESEAGRIREIVELATPYGCPVELYNHNGWFGQPDNEVAVIEQLKKLGVAGVGMVYNFSHGHEDIADFPAIWKRIQPYVVAVNITGMGRNGNRLIPPSQGDKELEMMRTILESGWRGPVGLIAEQGGDAEVTLAQRPRRDRLAGERADESPAPAASGRTLERAEAAVAGLRRHGRAPVHLELRRAPRTPPPKTPRGRARHRPAPAA